MRGREDEARKNYVLTETPFFKPRRECRPSGAAAPVEPSDAA
jgi:hypothetical protein